jgi:hypothetical protein
MYFFRWPLDMGVMTWYFWTKISRQVMYPEYCFLPYMGSRFLSYSNVGILCPGFWRHRSYLAFVSTKGFLGL